jgi:hypothetical protein
VGITALGEIAAIDTESFFPAERFTAAMNAALPSGIEITSAANYRIRGGSKKHSLSSLFWGSGYVKKGSGKGAVEADLVRMQDEKKYRTEAAEDGCSNFDLVRTAVFAGADPASPASYFDVYGALYPDF